MSTIARRKQTRTTWHAGDVVSGFVLVELEPSDDGRRNWIARCTRCDVSTIKVVPAQLKDRARPFCKKCQKGQRAELRASHDLDGEIYRLFPSPIRRRYLKADRDQIKLVTSFDRPDRLHLYLPPAAREKLPSTQIAACGVTAAADARLNAATLLKYIDPCPQCLLLAKLIFDTELSRSSM